MPLKSGFSDGLGGGASLSFYTEGTLPLCAFCPSGLQHGYWSVAHTRCHAQRGTNRRQNRNQNLNQRLPCLFLHNFKL